MIREITMYQIVCDHDGCDSGAESDYSAWSDPGQAEEEWEWSAQIVDAPDGRKHYCPTHRRKECADCGATHDLAEWAGDHWCPAHIIDAQMEDPR